MSAENGKICCNCKHCIREWDQDGFCHCKCEVTGEYIGYLQVFEGWCRQWSIEGKKGENNE
jgi:hypothetical protein